MLRATLRRWLPGITGGRYLDAIVDRATLALKGHRERTASPSHSQQVYLLLRVALAQHLMTPGEQ